MFAYTHKITQYRKDNQKHHYIIYEQSQIITPINVRYSYICIVNNLFAHKMTFSERLKKARLEKGYSKSDLAKEIGIHYSQIGRYEEKGAQPSAEVLGKLANILEVSTDFLMNGTSDDLAQSSLTDKELLNQFKKIEKLPTDKKMIVKELLDAFLFKYNIKQQLQ